MIGAEYLAFVSCIGFLAFLLPGPHRKYAAVSGWFFIVMTLFSLLPEYFHENNFMYPAIAALSVPFFVITSRYLLLGNECAMNLSRAAAVAFLVYAPFGFDRIPLFAGIGNWLISLVVSHLLWILETFHFTLGLSCMDPVSAHPVTSGTCENLLKNVFTRNGYSVEIILGCTGIQSIAIMLGVAAAVPTSIRQKMSAFLVIVPTIYFLNLLRNVFVIMAYTDQWFPFLADIAGNGVPGYESFFWAHNVIAELLALVCLVAIAYGLFAIIPKLGVFADDLYILYRDEVKKALWGKKKSPDSI